MSDRATQTAFDPAAPADERTEALSQLQRQYMPAASDIAPVDTLRQFLDQAQIDLEESPLNKAINSNIVPFPSHAARTKEPGQQSVVLDEYLINIQGEYYERPSAMSFDAMRAIVEQTPVLNAVISTRIRQVQRFCGIAESGNDLPGFEIRHRDREHKLSKTEQENLKQLGRFVSNCGWEFKPRLRKRLHRDSFTQFMARSVRDSLTLDSAPIELEWKKDMKKGIDGFYAVDGATIRLCTELGYNGDEDIFALQLVDGRISTAYTFDDLVYEARVPRTDVRAGAYGYSEVELLVRIITGYINALTYNIKGFDSNAIPKGILHLSGQYSDQDMAQFRRYWNAMVKGINNAWSLPVLFSKDQDSKAAFEKFGVEFNEMYFAKWMTFLTSVICAVYGMSPAEINFDAFSGGSSSPLSGSDTAEKLAASKDNGLRPLLSYYENVLTEHIISEFSDDYVFRFTGLDPEDADKKHEKKKLILTTNEMRAEEGYKPMKDKLIGDAPLNPSLMGLYQQANAPQDPNGGAPGAPGAPGGDGAAPSGDQDAGAGGDAEENPDFGDLGQPDFGTGGDAEQDPDLSKAFGLPVYSVKDLQ